MEEEKGDIASEWLNGSQASTTTTTSKKEIEMSNLFNQLY